MPNNNKPKLNNATRARMAARRKAFNNALNKAKKKNNSVFETLRRLAMRG
jgi:hypothetical protein